MSNDEERLVKRATEAVEALTCALKEAAGVAHLVTRCDLNAMEARIMAGWKPSAEDLNILDALLARSGRVARKLEALDAKTPPAQ